MHKHIWRQIRAGAAALWYEEEKECLLCGQKSAQDICPPCQERWLAPLTRPGASGGRSAALENVIALGCYEGPWRELIHQIKFNGQPYLLAPLAEHLTKWAAKQLPPPDLVTPVPMHEERLRERGFNQAEVLASFISGNLGLPMETVLERTKNTIPQTRLGKEERLQNLQGAFCCRGEKQIKGKTIWLTDDVFTTGATLGHCAETLQKAGSGKIYGLVLLIRTEPKIITTLST